MCFDSAGTQSKTLDEFWSVRWNQSIARQLRNLFFKPFAALGYFQAGQLLTFMGSSFLHIYPFYLMEGRLSSVYQTFAFFIVQLGVIKVEKTLKIKSRLWVWSVFLATFGLFLEPTFDIFPARMPPIEGLIEFMGSKLTIREFLKVKGLIQ